MQKRPPRPVVAKPQATKKKMLKPQRHSAHSVGANLGGEATEAASGEENRGSGRREISSRNPQ
jgi:hypothetical protein